MVRLFEYQIIEKVIIYTKCIWSVTIFLSFFAGGSTGFLQDELKTIRMLPAPRRKRKDSNEQNAEGVVEEEQSEEKDETEIADPYIFGMQYFFCHIYFLI